MLAGSKIKEEAHITRGSLFTVAALVPAAPRIPSDLGPINRAITVLLLSPIKKVL